MIPYNTSSPLFSDLQGSAAQLATFTSTRLLEGFRPAIIRQYHRMWQDFMLYQVVARLPPCHVDIHFLLSFHQHGHFKFNIANYMAAVRTFHIIHGLPTEPFRDQRIKLYLKALKINAPFNPATRPTLDVAKLNSLLLFCDTVPHAITFKALYVTCFFSFLRISNILPHSLAAFDNTRHLARGDFLVSGDAAVLLLKWSKTIQDRKFTLTIPLPNLAQSPLCPVTANQKIIQNMPASPNDPLFTITKSNRLVPLTDSVGRKHLKNASIALNISPTLMFHAFRRAGASWAFSHEVNLEHIMRHGTWKSDAIWTYLSSSPSTLSHVSATFQAVLHH